MDPSYIDDNIIIAASNMLRQRAATIMEHSADEIQKMIDSSADTYTVRLEAIRYVRDSMQAARDCLIAANAIARALDAVTAVSIFPTSFEEGAESK